MPGKKSLASHRDVQPIEGHRLNKSSCHAIALIAPALRANEQSHGMAVRADANLVASKRAKGRRGLCSLCSQRFSRWAGLMGTLLVCSQGIWRKRCRPLLVCSQTVCQSVGSAGLCSFARNAMTGKAKVRHGDGKAVGRAEAERDDEAMDYLFKPSLLFVAGLTLGVAIAKATAVAKLRIKQFWAIPLAGKVVALCPMMAMPLCLL